MFRKSQRKIVITIMSVLTCLFLGTLAVIYTASYFEVANTNFDMLEHHVEMYMLRDNNGLERTDKQLPDGQEPFQEKENRLFKEPAFQLSTFYSVALGGDGQILATDIGNRDLYNETTLEKYAVDILNSGKTKGTKGSLVYLVAEKDEYTLVAFMDNTVIKESMATLFRYTFVFGSIALVIIFFVSCHFAKKIVAPLETSYMKQKQFISDAGHELKTPVTVINANIDILNREIGENKWLENIQYENRRMGKLVGQLLELARTEALQQLESLDFSRLVEGSVLPFESVAFENGFTLQTQLLEQVIIKGNRLQLNQLVAILVDNAIQHGLNTGDLVVRLTQNRNAAVLSVINAGDPIPPEKMEQLFERFYRVDESRNDQNCHYGLGLAIAKAIVQVHKGKIEALCHDGLIEFRVTIPKV